jgi:hypothetical protein
MRQTFTLTAEAVSNSETDIDLAEIDDVSLGSFLAIDDELMYVRAITPASKTATVIRGQRATSAVTHANGALVEINPKFPRYRVRRALGEEIRAWTSEVFSVAEVDLDTTSGTAGYDLVGVPAGFLTILDVQLGPRSGITDGAVVKANWDLVRNADTSIYPSGNGLVITSGLGNARDLRVIYAVGFDTSSLADSTDVEADIGLATSMLDIPPLGAAARLMVGREVKRTFGEGQPEPRRSEEVPVGASSGTATYLRREANRRLGEEAVRLRALYGWARR